MTVVPRQQAVEFGDGAEGLVRAGLSGDSRALESLVDLLQPLVFNLCQKFLLNPQDSEDAAQEILVRVVTRLDSFDPARGTGLRPWVLAIARNHLIDQKRRNGRMESLVTGFPAYGEGLDAIPNEEIADPRALDPAQRSLALEANASCMLGMLLCLDREQRITIILGDVLDLPGDECALIAGISAAAFRQRLVRARADLHSFMRDKCGLVNKSNPCRCYRKAKGFLAQGWIDPHKRVWTDQHYHNMAVFAEQEAPRAFDLVTERYAAMFRGLPAYDAGRSVIDVKSILEDPEIRRRFRFG